MFPAPHVLLSDPGTWMCFTNPVRCAIRPANRLFGGVLWLWWGGFPGFGDRCVPTPSGTQLWAGEGCSERCAHQHRPRGCDGSVPGYPQWGSTSFPDPPGSPPRSAGNPPGQAIHFLQLCLGKDVPSPSALSSGGQTLRPRPLLRGLTGQSGVPSPPPAGWCGV